MGVLKPLTLAALVLCAGACATRSLRYDEDFAAAPADVQQDWQLTKDRCNSCHKVDRAFLNMELYGDRGDVQLLVEDMASLEGSGISQEDMPRIVNALDWYRQQP